MAELKTFLFTDICGSVRLKGEMTGRSVTERDQAFIEQILSPHRQRIEGRLAEFDGRVVSTAGDGHFLVFDNTVQAALWAVGVQESHRDDPIKTPSGDAVEVRISMHVGVPQIDPSDPNNFVGKSVDYAARLNDYATGAQILVSRSVMAILDDVGLEGIRLHSHGKKSLKGIGNVEIHEVLYDDQGPRPLRSHPKTDEQRQWTVLPTLGFDEAGERTIATARDTALKRVGNYELEELLGAGGMGDVYKARHVQFGRVRAVKVIKPQFVGSGQGDMVRRFYNEIKAIGRLEHKNIVVAIDSSAPTDKLHYLVMEYVDGVGVDDLVARRGQLPIPEACEIIRQAARGLQYIYKHDMVHRDLKPSNLMVSVVDADQGAADSTVTQQTEGERAVVKILDLGLALLTEDGHDRLTRFDNKAMGTGMYMSPEQWKTSSVDIRADIYSLGCTLYHLLSGNPPFHDSDLRPEKAHEKSAVPPIRSGTLPIPKKLWDVVRKMLEKRPEDRYATPAEVSAALTPFCEGQQLAKLVRGYQFDAEPSKIHSQTVADASAQADTWRSRSKAGTGSLWNSATSSWRRIAQGAGIAAVFLGVIWLFYSSKQQRIAQALEDARQNLPTLARVAAGERGDLGPELAHRFEALVQLAQDKDMIALVARRNADPKDAKALEELDHWISHATHETNVTPTSWFIDDAVGNQIARSPKSDTIGDNYRKRDYFHGQGLDLTDPAEIQNATPIRAAHLSTVYSSDSDQGKLKVALSVPIWSSSELALAEKEGTSAEEASTPTIPPTDAVAERPHEPAEGEGDPPAEPAAAKREVIGVLGMSVNVADFDVLAESIQGDAQLVLVDLRPTTIDGKSMKGIVLQHPGQEPGQPRVIDAKVFDAITAADPWNVDFKSQDHFLEDYPDPFDAKQRYWGAFQPVTIKLPKEVVRESQGGAAEGADANGQPRWVVLVQKPRKE